MQQQPSESLALAVLRRLGDGEFHSGSRIAADLGFSRARIWQAVEECAALGVEVFRVPGRGYRLAAPLCLLDAQAIARHSKSNGWRVRVADRLESTNTVLARAANQRDVHGEALVAEIQTAGRGRLGRSWHSRLGSSLTFSVAWRFNQGLGTLSGLSLAVGLAVVRTLESLGAQGTQLKWPNDLLVHGRKLGGILVEVQGDALGPSTAVIGVGLNVCDGRRITAQSGQVVADLSDAGLVEVDRNQLLAALLQALAHTLERFAAEGFGPLHHEWNKRDAYRHVRIRLTRPAGPAIEGVAGGVDAHGALVLQTERGRERFVSGELSVREPAPDSA